jgi:hypothetical protein
MTTKISTVIDAVHTEMDLLFSSTKTKIPNPYSLEDNPITLLRDGYGIYIGESSPADLDVLKDDNETITINIVLTKEVYRLENNNSNLVVAEKAILEDRRILKNRMLAFNQLNQGASIQKIDFISSDSINVVTSGKFSVLSNVSSFGITYSEVIT